MKKDIEKGFKKAFSSNPEVLFFTPGRVNLIGEHTDYNGGHVFPCAIHLGIYAGARKRTDQKLCLISGNISKEIHEYDINQLAYVAQDGWTNYPKGVFHVMGEAYGPFPFGMDIYYEGNIPPASGLSSSAAIEVLTASIINHVYQLGLDPVNLALLSQKAENTFVGVQSGILDQFAVAMGKKDQAILLDTNTLKYDYVPFVLDDYSIVISNTNKKRGLEHSKYNERRLECEEALRDLQIKLDIQSLGELTEEAFENNKYLISSPVNTKRARHAVYENQRTLKAFDALNQGNLIEFGQLMNQSHESLKEDYEVTGLELDTLVELAQQHLGVIGSRMTGAGFGGCTVSLVKNSEVEGFIQEVGTQYLNQIGYPADFYVTKPSEGAFML